MLIAIESCSIKLFSVISNSSKLGSRSDSARAVSTRLMRSPFTKAECFIAWVLAKEIINDVGDAVFIEQWGLSKEVSKRYLREFKQWASDHDVK